jgi:hypothetical protein
MKDTFDFPEDMQDVVLATLLRHSSKLAYAVGCLKPIYFGGAEATLTARAALGFYTKYGQMPTFPVLGELARDANSGISDNEALPSARDPC